LKRYLNKTIFIQRTNVELTSQKCRITTLLHQHCESCRFNVKKTETSNVR